MKRVFFFVFLFFSLFIINNLIHSISSLLAKHTLVEQAQLDLDKQQKENKELRKQLATVSTQSFVEEEARSKLLLGKSGEKELVLPPLSSSSSSKQPEITESLPVWKQWISLFF